MHSLQHLKNMVNKGITHSDYLWTRKLHRHSRWYSKEQLVELPHQASQQAQCC